MEATEELWDLYWTHIENSKFSLIAAQLLEEEAKKETDERSLKDYYRRQKRHIRASKKHLRQAKRIRRTIDRIERKANGG
ncbi:hypothetical protein PBI_CAMILLE_50 [Microbacterium phage Camille]|nr:hypothetical protein PBI_CAMILLE_50 [Microbacterium phage Camille]